MESFDNTSSWRHNSVNANSMKKDDLMSSIWDSIPNASFYNDNQGSSEVRSPSLLLSAEATDNASSITQKSSLLTDLYSLENQAPIVSDPLDLFAYTNELNSSRINEEFTMLTPDSIYLPIQELSWSKIASYNLEVEHSHLQTLHETEDVAKVDTPTTSSVKFLSDSKFVRSANGIPMFSLMPPTRPYKVLKIKNVPWYSSSKNISDVLKRAFDIPSDHILPLNIHFIINKESGKTTGLAYAEVILKPSGSNKLSAALKSIEKLPIQGRCLKVTLSNYDELRKTLFNDWPGEFENGIAIPSTSRGDASTSNAPDLLVHQKDLQSIQNICKNFKSCFNRQCPERPFEFLMSIIMNIPWLQKDIVLTWQRDLMYESYKLITDILRNHISKPLHTIDNGLLPRFIRAFILCDGFTIKQKLNILRTSGLECPEDLIPYVTEAPEDDITTTIN